MITNRLSLAPKDQISRVVKMLADEYGTASNIKSRVNRLSVLSAITSTQQRLKLYNKGKQRKKKRWRIWIPTQREKEKHICRNFKKKGTKPKYFFSS